MKWIPIWLAMVSSALAAEEWKLVWSDEFEGDRLDPAKWDYQVGNGFYNYGANQWIAGWGNDERQYYTEAERNVSVTEGHLVIRALKESMHGCGYTSGRLRTVKRDGTPLFTARYGKFEVRAKLPTGLGVWPAIWMLPETETYGGWAASGEIDIMEARGHEPGKVLGTIHYGSPWPANVHGGGEYRFPEGEGIDGWHTYGLEWDPGELRWYVDGRLYSTKNFWWSSSKVVDGKGVAPASEDEVNAWPAPFDRPFHLLLNLAVGGRFPGNPDATTPFPAEMRVDFVRVYRRDVAETKARGDGELPF